MNGQRKVLSRLLSNLTLERVHHEDTQAKQTYRRTGIGNVHGFADHDGIARSIGGLSRNTDIQRKEGGSNHEERFDIFHLREGVDDLMTRSVGY